MPPPSSAPESTSEPARPGLFVQIEHVLAKREAPLIVLCGWLVLLGVYFRLHQFGFPSEFQFDEHHFVENARNYLLHRPDQNDHPPLGKLLIAQSIVSFGDNATAWRLPSLVFGCLSVGFGAAAAQRLFRQPFTWLVAAAFLTVDGFLVAYSRAALLDGGLSAMAITALFAATLPRLGQVVWVGGLAAGVAMSIKFSGIGALFAPLLAIAWHASSPRQRWLHVTLLSVLAGVIYFATYLVGLQLAGHSPSPVLVVTETRRLIEQHAVLTDMKNSATSSWPTWLFPTRPLIMGSARDWTGIRALTSLGNLALWWSACGLALASGAVLVWKGLRWALAGSAQEAPVQAPSVWGSVEGFLGAHGRASLLALAAALGFLLPWVVTHRDSYIYHFLPSYSLFLILLAAFVSRGFAERRSWVVPFLVVVTLVAGLYGPLSCYLPLSEGAFRSRLFVPSWR